MTQDHRTQRFRRLSRGTVPIGGKLGFDLQSLSSHWSFLQFGCMASFPSDRGFSVGFEN